MLTIAQALRDIGVDVPDSSRQIQIACPFHKGGAELQESARIYPESNSFYCWVCKRTAGRGPQFMSLHDRAMIADREIAEGSPCGACGQFTCTYNYTEDPYQPYAQCENPDCGARIAF